MLAVFVSDPYLLTKVQTFKGWFYVVVTAFIAFILLQKEFAAREIIGDELRKHKDNLEEIIEERTASLEALNIKLSRIGKALEGTSDAIVITTEDNQVIYQNKAHELLFGYTTNDLISMGSNFSVFYIDPATTKQMAKSLRTKKSWTGEVEIKRQNGTPLTTYLRVNAVFDDEGKCIGKIGIHTDLTEKRRIEKEIARLERLHLIGEMAAGIGHEIRNPMTTVRGFLQLLGEKDDLLVHKEHFDLMIEELDRANGIITEYLTLAKNKAIDLKLTDLNEIIQTLIPLLQANATLNENNIVFNPETIKKVCIDEKEIRQMILNISKNGFEAMDKGGTLFINTYMQENEAVLCIKDQGHGIRTDLVDKIGTPFFTTKDFGTGLGLAVCYSIATRHKARIQVETNQTGTTFFIYFPTS